MEVIMNEHSSINTGGLHRHNAPASSEGGESQKFLCSAARRYAHSIATDDGMFVRAYLAALNSGVQLRHPSPGTSIHNVVHDEALPSPRLIGDPVYTSNARRLYESPHTVTIPDSDNLDPAFESCIVVEQNKCRFTGVLVARNVAITVAHMINPDSQMRMLIGGDANAPMRITSAKGVSIHPQFNAATHANDIAVIILEEDISHIKPAGIAESDQIDSATTVRIVGFGHENTSASVRSGLKRAVDVAVASTDFTGMRDRRNFRFHQGTELMMGLPALGRDRCAIDGGSPYYVRTGNRWRVACLASRPVAGYHYPCGEGTIAVRLDIHLSWIRSMSGGRW